jgi:cholesterol transport system auxiliary component
VYVERAVSRALFERHRNRRVFGAGAPTLDLELSAFDEVRAENGRQAFVQFDALLSEANEVIWQGSVSAREPVSGPGIESLVAAMASALEHAAESLAQQVGSALVVHQPVSDLAPSR